LKGNKETMDIFEVLSAIIKRKIAIIHSGIDEQEALIKAELDISKEYHIPLFDIKKIVRA
jgi:hypothetical protein